MSIPVSALKLLTRCRDSYEGRDPVSLMGHMMLLSLGLTQGTDDLVDIDLPCRHEETSLSILGATFFERGWLVPSSLYVRLTSTIALGDIGYMTEAGNFVVVDNVHRSMQAESGTLSWSEHLDVRSGGKYFEDTPPKDIVSRAGKAYQRRRQVRFHGCIRLG